MTRGQFAPYVGLRRFDEGVGKCRLAAPGQTDEDDAAETEEREGEGVRDDEVVGRDEAQVDSTPDLEPVSSEGSDRLLTASDR
jgi:hypothetical protein